MKLIFAYVSKFKSLENQSFYFSRDYKVEYIKNLKTVDIEKVHNEQNITASSKNFFGIKVYNLTGIIGENGTGKSSLLQFILGEITELSNGGKGDFFIIYLENEQIKVIHRGYSELRFEGSIDERYIKELGDRESQPFENLEIIYYSSLFDGNSLSDGSYNYREKDISTNEIVKDCIKHGKNYELQEIQVFLSLLSNISENPEKAKEYKEHIKSIPLPHSIKLEYNTKLYSARDELKESSVYFQTIQKLIENRDIYPGKQFLLAFVEALIIKASTLKIKLPLDQSMNNLLISSNKEDILKAINYYINYLNSTSIDGVEKFKIDKVPEFIDDLFKIGLVNADRLVEVLNVVNLNLVLRTFDSFNFPVYPTVFSWYAENGTSFQMSSGQKTYLSLFARLQRELYTIKEGKDILLLLDEPDIGLHPNWNKSFIQLILDFLNYNFDNLSDKSIQIIITTHSPFIASDLPQQNIIFLGDGFENKTFAANINDLLSNSFFMKDGLVGDFAKNKVLEVIKHLRSKKKDYEHFTEEYVYQIIDLIGEPTVRGRLLDEFLQVYDLGKDERVEKLEKEIKNLKSENNG